MTVRVTTAARRATFLAIAKSLVAAVAADLAAVDAGPRRPATTATKRDISLGTVHRDLEVADVAVVAVVEIATIVVNQGICLVTARSQGRVAGVAETATIVVSQVTFPAIAPSLGKAVAVDAVAVAEDVTTFSVTVARDTVTCLASALSDSITDDGLALGAILHLKGRNLLFSTDNANLFY